jgi:hypothetical protein
MRDALDARPVRGRAPGDQYDRQMEEAAASTAVATVEAHPLDSEANRKIHRQLLQWFYLERELQAANRLEMAMDADAYDNEQWDPQDAAIVRERGQMPLVYNEVAPMADWIIGTERRTRIDWRVLPRTEDDVKLADTKTKVLKYVSDINRVQFNRSRAFADAIKAGVGWVDDGVRDDPTKDILYSKYEDWRNVLWDSKSYDLDLDDARYVFRWRWVDVDVALMICPDRKAQILAAAEDAATWGDADVDGDEFSTPLDREISRSGALRAQGAGVIVDAQRRRVRLIEAQYRMPVKVSVVRDGPFRGSILTPHDQILADNVGRLGSSIVDRVMMRTHIALFTEGALLSNEPSIYRHNKFSLTPIWCYRRGRDRLPYGVIRRVRDIQMDLNKRASKALFMLNSNQIIADEGAVESWDVAREEADRPDGVIVKKQGKEFAIRRDTDAATGQVQMMTLDAQSIQKSGGVNDENLGRQTNAVSGEAIRARQLQGSVSTTEPFDNLRFGTQAQGEKQLSLTEQFYTEEKVVRLTGAQGAIEWVRINQPEQQTDGSVRFLNDITASQADFIVTEQDYAGTLRQVMFEALRDMAQRLPPEISLRLMTIAMQFSDLPNKDLIADQIRRLTGERDPEKEQSPEELVAAERQAQQQAEALEFQRQQAMGTLEEQRAKVREINARAAKLEAEAMAAGAGQGSEQAGQIEAAVRQVQEQAAQQIERLSEQLRVAQNDAAIRVRQINKDADTKLELAAIERDTKLRVAEIQAASDERIAKLQARLETLENIAQDARGAGPAGSETEPGEANG